MAILAGGKATRLGPLAKHTPKSLLQIEGKPFLEYQLQVLRRGGITEVVLCLGHLAQPVIDYLEHAPFGDLRILCSREATPLGTAGALKLAESLLSDPFFVTYGDSYLPLDYAAIWAHFHRFDRLALMVVYDNHNHYDRSNVTLDSPFVAIYDKANPTPEMVHIDAGVSLLRKRVLELIPPGQTADLTAILGGLARQRQLLSFEAPQRFHEVGSPAGLEEFSQLVASGELQ